MAFYEGSDGPRLMLFGPNEVNFRPLIDSFQALANSEGIVSFELESLPWVFATGDLKLRLASSERKGDAPNLVTTLGIRRVASNAFVWQQDNEGWQHTVELLEGMLSSQLAGHQYLTSLPIDDVMVVVSRGEYADELLKS